MTSDQPGGRASRDSARTLEAPSDPQASSRGDPIGVTERQLENLRAIADCRIPGRDGFPAPGEVRVVEDFVARYIARDGEDARFPCAVEGAFKAALDLCWLPQSCWGRGVSSPPRSGTESHDQAHGESVRRVLQHPPVEEHLHREREEGRRIDAVAPAA